MRKVYAKLVAYITMVSRCACDFSLVLMGWLATVSLHMIPYVTTDSSSTNMLRNGWYGRVEWKSILPSVGVYVSKECVHVSTCFHGNESLRWYQAVAYKQPHIHLDVTKLFSGNITKLN